MLGQNLAKVQECLQVNMADLPSLVKENFHEPIILEASSKKSLVF